MRGMAAARLEVKSHRKVMRRAGTPKQPQDVIHSRASEVVRSLIKAAPAAAARATVRAVESSQTREGM